MSITEIIFILTLTTSMWLISVIVTTVFHEFGHAITDRFFGGAPTLYHNFVKTSEHQNNVAGLVTAMGLVFTLLQGVICLIVFIRLSINGSSNLLKLLALNLLALGFSTLFGYLLITPIKGAGDTHKLSNLLGLSIYARVLISIVGAVLLTILAGWVGQQYYFLSPFAPEPIRLSLILFVGLPWLISSSIMLVLNGFNQNFIVKIFPFFSGFFVFIFIADGGDKPITQATEWSAIGYVDSLLILFVLVVCIWGYLYLKNGYQMGRE